MTARRTGAVSAAVLFGLVLAPVFAHAVAPSWAARAGLDVWNLPELRAAGRDAAEAREQLEAGREQLFADIDAGHHLAARVAAGSVSLTEAADEFAPRMRHRPGFEVVYSCHYDAPNLRLGTARYLILGALAGLEDDPCRRSAVEARLEAEYSGMK